VCVFKVLETLAAGTILALRSYHSRPSRDVTPGDDVIKMATPAWAVLPDARRVIVGGRDRKLLCSLTATVRSADKGSGNVEEDSDIDEDRLRFSHFIFRNRMQISQRC